jgi:2-methylcitrate dehydratase PrpD
LKGQNMNHTVRIDNDIAALAAPQLAAFVAGIKPSDIPAQVFDRAVLSILDTIASAAGGAVTANARQMREAAADFFGPGDSSLWFTAGQSTHRAAAILGNCAASSALDIDDGHRGASGHPGAAIIPAVLQEAKALHRDGRDILTAIVLGYEVALRIASARLPGTVTTYSSGRWTGYGVAAAIGWLRDLNVVQLGHAIAIAGLESPENLPAGSYRRMSSVKGSSPWSTLTALMAVERAARGADGPEDALDRPTVYDVGAITRDLGSSWAIEFTYMKPYASCRYTHPSMDAVFDIIRNHGVNYRDITSLSVDIFPEVLTITNAREPATLEAAQFSVPFCAALAAVRGARAFQPMRESVLTDPEVLALSQKVTMAVSPDFSESFPALTPGRVRISTSEGSFEKTVMHPLGDVAAPLKWDDVRDKMRWLGASLPPGVSEAVIDGVEMLARANSSSLFAALES